jgi:hypothetical protein
LGGCAFGGVVALLGACVTTQSGPDEPDRWQVDVLRGAKHVGTERVADWPPPAGPCVEATFTVDELPLDPTTRRPPSQVLLAFRHAGAAGGTIDINGKQVFAGVTGIDRIASALADAIVDVTVCAIESAFPGDPDCDPVERPIKTTGITRRLATDTLVIGTNTARLCATGADFLVVDARLTEAPSTGDAGAQPDSRDASDRD